MSIHILPLQLVNQIAAGEIIDSPAAVVKELIENSLDANSTYIDVHIEKGGMKSIIVKDNGSGMSKKDLTLSIKNHATSKIFSIKDLDEIRSLGFRGEALASINEVSRIILISSISNDVMGWKLYSETRNNSLTLLTPTPHPKGTSIYVLNLFYNRPVRKNYFYTEKSEFLKIKEMIKRFALSKDNFTIIFRSDNKLILKCCKIKKNIFSKKRLSQLLGPSFVNNFLSVTLTFELLQIQGWISKPEIINSVKTINYYYVNGRIIYNKVFKHAINQAINEVYGNNYSCSSILRLKIPFNYLNVNIHPSKKEVNFYKLRTIHSFIYQSILNVLKKYKSKTLIRNDFSNWIIENKNIAGINLFSKKLENVKSKDLINQKNISHKKNNSFSKNIIILIKKKYVLIEYKRGLALISLLKAKILLQQFTLIQGVTNGLKIKYLEEPHMIIVPKEKNNIFLKYKKLLFHLGFDISLRKTTYFLHTVPNCISKNLIDKLIKIILKFLFNNKECNVIILAKIIVKQLTFCISNWNYFKIVVVLKQLEKYLPEVVQKPPSDLLQKIDINLAMSVLK